MGLPRRLAHVDYAPPRGRPALRSDQRRNRHRLHQPCATTAVRDRVTGATGELLEAVGRRGAGGLAIRPQRLRLRAVRTDRSRGGGRLRHRSDAFQHVSTGGGEMRRGVAALAPRGRSHRHGSPAGTTCRSRASMPPPSWLRRTLSFLRAQLVVQTDQGLRQPMRRRSNAGRRPLSANPFHPLHGGPGPGTSAAMDLALAGLRRALTGISGVTAVALDLQADPARLRTQGEEVVGLYVEAGEIVNVADRGDGAGRMRAGAMNWRSSMDHGD